MEPAAEEDMEAPAESSAEAFMIRIDDVRIVIAVGSRKWGQVVGLCVW